MITKELLKITRTPFSQRIAHALVMLVLFIVLSLSSCATIAVYDGPKLQRDKVGVLKLNNKFFAMDCGHPVIMAVDGKTLEAVVKAGQYAKIELLPGDHTIVIDVVDKFDGNVVVNGPSLSLIHI